MARNARGESIFSPGDRLSFGQAFARAREAGVDIFEWQGKPYTTELKEEAQDISNRAVSEDVVAPEGFDLNQYLAQTQATPVDAPTSIQEVAESTQGGSLASIIDFLKSGASDAARIPSEERGLLDSARLLMGAPGTFLQELEADPSGSFGQVKGAFNEARGIAQGEFPEDPENRDLRRHQLGAQLASERTDPLTAFIGSQAHELTNMAALFQAAVLGTVAPEKPINPEAASGIDIMQNLKESGIDMVSNTIGVGRDIQNRGSDIFEQLIGGKL